MRQTKKNKQKSIPQWQLNKMNDIIVDRWQEVWQIVEARHKRNRELKQRH